MTVGELARAMEKDIGGSDTFIRKNMGTWDTWYLIFIETKAFKDENQTDGLKRYQIILIVFTLGHRL